MPDPDSFAELMAALRRGDDRGLGELFARYSARLRALARARLGERLERQGEQSDVLQSMWMSFVRRQRAGEFDRVGGWDDLWTLLACLTARKCIDRVRYFAAARRTPPADAASAEPSAADPGPAEQAVYAEAFERFLSALDPRDRQIVCLHLQGLEDDQISAEVGWSERTVARVRQHARDLLEAQLAD